MNLKVCKAIERRGGKAEQLYSMGLCNWVKTRNIAKILSNVLNNKWWSQSVKRIRIEIVIKGLY